MATFKELQDRVLLNRFDDATYRPLVKDYLNDANRLIHRRLDLPADEAVTTFPTVAGTRDYTAPAGLRVLDAFIDVDPFLELLEKESIEVDARAQEDSGRPEVYALSGGKIKLAPLPDAVYTISVRVLAGAPKMTVDGDVPSIPEEYHELLDTYATSKCCRKEDDFEAAAALMADFETGFQRLAIDLQNAADDGPLQVPGAWGLDGYRG